MILSLGPSTPLIFKAFLKTVRLSPGFSATVAGTIALGIGAATAIFTVVNGVLLEAPPWEAPERLVFLLEEVEEAPPRTVAVSWQNFVSWRDEAVGFKGLAARAEGTMALTGVDEARRVRVGLVSSGYFSVFGVSGMRGREFARDENITAGGHPLAVVTRGFWSEYFGTEPFSEERSIELDGLSYAVVGVLPSNWVDPFEAPDEPIEIFVPAVMISLVNGNGPSSVNERRYRRFSVVGRLADGRDLAEVQAGLDDLGDTLERRFPDDNGGYGIYSSPLRETLTEGVREPVLTLFGGALVLLMIALANVTSLFLVRAVSRRGEMATRVALGAGTRALATTWLTESVGLALVGGVLGIVASQWLISILLALLPFPLPATFEVRPNLTVLGASIAATALVGLLVGIAPLAWSRDGKVRGAMGTRAAGGVGRRWWSAMVVFEVATAMVLLVGSGLLVKSFVILSGTEVGFRTEGVLVVEMDLPPSRYRTRASMYDFSHGLAAELGALPGVDEATVWGIGRPGAAGVLQSIVRDGEAPPQYGDADVSRRHSIDPGGLATMGIEILRGRDFDGRDGPDTNPVAIVSESFADLIWPGQDPLGRRFHQFIPNGSRPDLYPTYTVIGVAADASHSGRLVEGGLAQEGVDFYRVNPQGALARFSILLTTTGEAAALTSTVRERVRSWAPGHPITDIRPLEDYLAQEAAPARFSATLMTIFGVLAVALTALGVYGVLAFSTRQRRREIGLRSALGATGTANVLLFFREGMVLAAVGIVVGTLVSAWAVRFVATLLFNVPALDPTIFLGAGAAIAFIAAASAWVPARRAAIADPAEVLRGG